MDPILQKFRSVFLEEITGLLDQLEKDLLDLETSPNNHGLIESAFRVMHTIKGASGMYGFHYISELTHHLESMYQAIRDKKMSFDKSVFDITFLSIDHIRKLLSDEHLGILENQASHNMLISDLHLLVKSADPQNKTLTERSESNLFGTWHILIRVNEQIYFRGISMIGLFQDLAALGQYDIVRLDFLSNENVDTWSVILYSDARENEIRELFMFIEEDCTITRISGKNLLEDSFEEKPEKEVSILDYIRGQDKETDTSANNLRKTYKSNDEHTTKTVKRISVDSAKLDHLMYLVSELITLNSQFNLNVSEKNETMDPLFERLDTLSKQFRNNALDIRLVPISESIVRFKRLIRDLSRQLDKNINLITEGIDTEVDKGIIDHLNELLMHIIRNCIDHGIELPHIRKQKGKPVAGTIKISATNPGNYVVIRVEDDGAGINMGKIHRKALEKGLIKASDKPSRQELMDMVFLPGFSTAESLSEVSGRGVGMDVVKRKINELRGDITVESEKEIGTVFILKLQQSMTIVDTLLFKIQESYFTVPISDIDVCLQIPFSEIIQRKQTGTIHFKDGLIPYIDLRKNLQMEGTYPDIIKAIVLQNKERQLAIITDSIIGGHQAVLKSLGKLFQHQKCIAAASQLGDGKLAFMLDTGELFETAGIN